MCETSRRIKTRRHRGGMRRGAAAVEFAVVAPLFFLLLAGIIEFGQAFRIQHMLTNVCRRGARSATLEGATTAKIRQDVTKNCVDLLGVSSADVTVVIAVNGSTSTDVSKALEGHEVGVKISVPYNKAGVGFYANMFSNSTLSSTCFVEHE